MTDVTIYDDTNCLLGEGPLWHPERGELYWFDILARRLLRKGRHWDFDDHVSAAGWVDRDRLLIASARALSLFDLQTGKAEVVTPLEADNPGTRSNDGRADPQGGLWIGTMGLNAEVAAGAIWRYYRGELRCLHPGITIPNAICFAPDGGTAYFTDTPTGVIQRQRLDPATGWPMGDPEPHVDLRGTGLNPDGAVVDCDGNLWNAQWGAGRVAVYDTHGRETDALAVPAAQATCPAFGGDGLTTLLCTSACAGLDQAHLATHPHSGRTFAIATGATGQAEHRVVL